MKPRNQILLIVVGFLFFGPNLAAQEEMTTEIVRIEAVKHIPIGQDHFVVWEVLYNVEEMGYRDYAVAYDQQVWARPGDVIPLKFSEEKQFYRIDHDKIEAVFSVATLKETLDRVGITMPQ